MVNLNGAESSSCGWVFNQDHPSFLQLFVPHKHSKKLGCKCCIAAHFYFYFCKRIPSAFIDAFNGNIPSTISLKNASGTAWKAKLENVGDRLYITTGWDCYVRGQSLIGGESLIFHFLQKESFLVVVYGNNGLIKQESSKKPEQEPLPKKTRQEPPQKPKGTRRPYTKRTSKNIDYRFVWDYDNNQNRVTLPQAIVYACQPKLPRNIILRFDNGNVLSTQLRKTWDRVIIGYFNKAEFANLSKADKGDKLLFNIIIEGNENYIYEIMVINATPKES